MTEQLQIDGEQWHRAGCPDLLLWRTLDAETRESLASAGDRVWRQRALMIAVALQPGGLDVVQAPLDGGQALIEADLLAVTAEVAAALRGGVHVAGV